jgi:hypothetical protein
MCSMTRFGSSAVLFVFVGWGVGACAEPAGQTASGASATSPTRAAPQVVEAVRAATTRSASPTEVVSVHNQGQLQRVTLGEGYQHVVVGRLEADGTVSTSCVDSAQQAEAFLSGGRRADAQ